MYKLQGWCRLSIAINTHILTYTVHVSLRLTTLQGPLSLISSPLSRASDISGGHEAAKFR